jgi:hypothetical protein
MFHLSEVSSETYRFPAAPDGIVEGRMEGRHAMQR